MLQPTLNHKTEGDLPSVLPCPILSQVALVALGGKVPLTSVYLGTCRATLLFPSRICSKHFCNKMLQAMLCNKHNCSRQSASRMPATDSCDPPSDPLAPSNVCQAQFFKAKCLQNACNRQSCDPPSDPLAPSNVCAKHSSSRQSASRMLATDTLVTLPPTLLLHSKV